MKKRPYRMDKGFGLSKLIVGIILTFHAAVLVLLLTFALSTALKSEGAFDENYFGFPDFAFSNFINAINNFYVDIGANKTAYLFPDIIINTLLYTIGGAFFSALIPCVMGYMVAKFNNIVSKFINGLVIVTMIIPIVGNQPAMINVLQTLRLYDSVLGTYLMRAHFLNLYFLIFHAAFKSLSSTYMEAAYIDGASEFRVMLSIMFPLVKTIFLTVVLLVFVELWNDYSVPLMYIPSHPTIAYGVYEMTVTTETGQSHMTFKMACCAIMVIPTTVLFIAFKDKLMGNLSMGGIKG